MAGQLPRVAGCSTCPRVRVRPNPSLERTSTGMALGPRDSVVHHPPRGPSAMPVAARSAQTLGRIEQHCACMHVSRKFVAGLVASVAAAVTGFVIHVGSQPWVQIWVTEHMQGRAVGASWDVRYVALATSIEVGVGLTLLYALVRQAMPVKSPVLRGLLLGVILLAVMGRLVRQPIMNLLIGNPLSVVIVQDGISWVLWPTVCVVVATVFERLAPQNAA